MASLGLIASQIPSWIHEDVWWYLGSAAVHALAILSLGLVAAVIPPAFGRPDQVSFDAAEIDRPPPTEIAHFEVGDPPLDPTELNADTLAMTKALPTAPQEARYYDDSAKFEEQGGGTASDLPGPKLGGLGGFSIKDLPGPAGLGGVGVGAGFGSHSGWGGAGGGLGGRGKGHREALVGSMGGTRASERAVGAALNWLARHQTTHGRWSLDFHHQCKSAPCSGSSAIKGDAAATAMALLPFLGAGQTHKSRGPYQATVAKGLAWLVSHQRADGDLSEVAYQPMYAHGLATIVLCEAYAITKDEHIGAAARRAVLFIEQAQDEASGGWRYRPKQFGDTSVTGWQIMALKSAQLAGIPVSTLVLERAKKWLAMVAAGRYSGLYCYQPSREADPTMTAVGMLCRQYMDLDPHEPSILEGKACLLQNPPDSTWRRDCYYWYYATLAMHNFADEDWDTWNRKMRRVLIESQEKAACAEGSWDPDRPIPDVWGQKGGRLMTTSFNALILEVYYRYLPLFRAADRPAEKEHGKPADTETTSLQPDRR